MTHGGISALALVDAATFLTSAAFIAGIRTSGRAEPDDGTAAEDRLHAPDGRLRALAADWMAGLRMAAGRRGLRAVFVYTLLVMTGEGVMGTLFVPFFVTPPRERPGVRNRGFSAGDRRDRGRAGRSQPRPVRLSPALMFGVGGFLFGLVDLVMFLYPLAYVEIWPAAVCMIVVGVPGAVLMAGYSTPLQRDTTDAYRGRVFGALGAVQGVAILTGTLGLASSARRSALLRSCPTRASHECWQV